MIKLHDKIFTFKIDLVSLASYFGENELDKKITIELNVIKTIILNQKNN